MPRSTKKGYYVAPKLWEKIQEARKKSSHKPIRTYSRESMITPDFVGLNMEIHNGKSFVAVFITTNMVGHRLGEFALTRTFKGHSSPTQKVQK